MTKGLPGSGKSWFSKALVESSDPGVVKRVSSDELRAMLNADVFSKKNEKFIRIARDVLIRAAFEQTDARVVVWDATNLNPWHFDQLTKLADDLGVAFAVYDLTTRPLEECIANDLNRIHSVGERVIRKMWFDYLKPFPPVYDDTLLDAVICDLDGTLALLGDRSPYDASKCELDTLNGVVAIMLQGFIEANVEIILLSGREGKYRLETQSWLDKHGIIYGSLYMRSVGDTRRDSLIKREIYDAEIAGKYNILAVIDDRPSVIRECWEPLGLPIVQVGTRVEF